MRDVAAAPFPLGKTYFGSTDTIPSTYATSTGLLGRQQVFEHDYSVATGMRAERRDSQNQVVAELVKNSSGIALLPGRVCVYKTGSEGKEVDGYTRTTAALGAGVVDPLLPAAGVRNGDYFWLIKSGPVLMLTDIAGADNNVINVGNVLYALTAATSQATTAGRVVASSLTFTSTATTDGTMGAVIVNRFGRALSAKTTANTNAQVLAFVNFLRD